MYWSGHQSLLRSARVDTVCKQLITRERLTAQLRSFPPLRAHESMCGEKHQQCWTVLIIWTWEAGSLIRTNRTIFKTTSVRFHTTFSGNKNKNMALTTWKRDASSRPPSKQSHCQVADVYFSVTPQTDVLRVVFHTALPVAAWIEATRMHVSLNSTLSSQVWEHFRWKQLPVAACNDPMRPVRVSQNSQLAADQLKDELKLTVMLRKARWAVGLRSNSLTEPSLWATLFRIAKLFSHCHLMHRYYKNIYYSHFKVALFWADIIAAPSQGLTAKIYMYRHWWMERSHRSTASTCFHICIETRV